MNDLEKSLLSVISEQEANIEKLEEIEEVISPACGCGCGGIC